MAPYPVKEIGPNKAMALIELPNIANQGWAIEERKQVIKVARMGKERKLHIHL